MNRPTLIGWYIIGWMIVILMTIFLSGCCHKTYESIVRDTVTTVRVDSIIVNMREVEVDVSVPQITLEQWCPIDTISILDNGYYVSIVEVVDGQIHHTLTPVEGAVIPATVTVSDTTHITTTTTNSIHHEKEKVTVKKEEAWWEKVRRSVGSWMIGIIVFVIFIVLCNIAVRRKL